MGTYRISELARRAGVPTSTVRYYECIGLVPPDARAANGYREYDENALDRLLWFAEECGPIQDRLRRFLTERIQQVRNRIADDTAFERQLQHMRARLTPDRAPDGRQPRLRV